MENQEAFKSALEKYRYAKDNYGYLEDRLDVDETWAVIEALEKIMEHQDLEEQGLLVRRPCKVGMRCII